jgi:tetratricopeptide (TPR) repeat protein
MTQSASKPSPVRSAWRRWHVLAFLVGALGLAGAGLVRWVRPVPPPEPPAIDPEGTDPAVVRAIEQARSRVLASPGAADTWGRLGAVLLAHKFSREAAVCLDRAEQFDGRDVRWPYLHAVAVQRLGPETAVAALRRAAALDGEEGGVVRLRLAELLLEQGQVEEAERLFRRALEVSPDNARAHLGMGRLERGRGALSAALPHLERAAADPHARRAATLLLAEVHHRLGDREQADRERARADDLAEDPPWPDPLLQEVTNQVTGHLMSLSRANQLLQQDRVPEALLLLRQTLQDYPDSDRAWYLVGKGLLQQKNLAGAETALRQANRLSPAVESQFELGVVLFLQERPADAAGYFRKVTEQKPDFARAYYNLGHCLKQQGDRAGAVEAFRNAVRAQPRLGVAHANLGELLAGEGKRAEALQHLREAVRWAPEDARARQFLKEMSK